jgi:hypothetical protein
MLKSGKHVGIFAQRDGVGFNNAAACIGAQMAEQIVMVPSARPAALDVNPLARFDKHCIAFLLKAAEKML